MFVSPRCRLFKGRDIVLQIFISMVHGDIVEKKCWNFEDNIICIKCTFVRRVDSLEKTDAGRDWGQEEKGTTEDEMAGWHH